MLGGTANSASPRLRAARSALLACAALLAFAVSATADEAGVQTASVQSAGEPLVGVGVVIGLPGTGDSNIDHAIIETSIVGVLERAGVTPWQGQIEPGRIAVVMLSAEMPAGSRDGTRLEVSVQAIGNATSLAGGTLLVAPLRDAAGVVHAVGQGAIGADDRKLAAGAVIQRGHGGETVQASLD